MSSPYKQLFIDVTPFHLLLMAALLIYTQRKINIGFLLFLISCFVVGVAVEIIGTSTGALFGHYEYGTPLGFQIYHVPLLIGINWFIIMYCCGVSVAMLYEKLRKKTESIPSPPSRFKNLAIILDAALLAVIVDLFLEPAAIKLGYWTWLGDGSVPTFNYVCWFLTSALLVSIFLFARFPKRNIFAVNLLLIQILFFLIVETFL